MEDYELGKLAEELIDSRYGAKLKAKDTRIKLLEDELQATKESRTYISITREHKNCYGPGEDPYKTIEVFLSIDDVTKELKESKKLNKKLMEELGIVAKVNIKLDRFIHRNKLSTYLYKKWLIEE